MPHGMTAWTGPFYKPLGEGASITRYQPPGIKSTSISEEDMSLQHSSQISPLITGKITNYNGKNHFGHWIERVSRYVFVKFGSDASFPPLPWCRKREKIKKAFLV